MNTITMHIGDVRDVMAELPDGHADLLVTSPPFLALRSYLPSDHPDKHREIGSEPTPAAFLDTLYGLSADWRRLVPSWGSICVELGDTSSGSGGAGGDYNADGLRDGQAKFDGAARRTRSNNLYNTANRYSDEWNKGNTAGKPIEGVPVTGGSGWPDAKSMCLIPHLYTIGLAYGHNPLTGSPSPAGRWRVRNVVAWARPNPPVGSLGKRNVERRTGDQKFRPATSYITIACTGTGRYFDLDAVRTEPKDFGPRYSTTERDAPGQSIQRFNKLDEDGLRVQSNPAGAPPLDWHTDDLDGDWLWRLPTQPYSGSHYAVYPLTLPRRLVLAMCPERVCGVCGWPSERKREHLGTRRFKSPPTPAEFAEELTVAMRRAEMTHHEVAARLGVGESMIRHYLGKSGKANHQLPSINAWEQLDAFLPFDWWVRDAFEVVDAEYKTVDRGNRTDPRRLDHNGRKGDPPKVVPTGWTDCGCSTDGSHWRPGRVLDPFGGSGTTAVAAALEGRDAVLIDIDARNIDLVHRRLSETVRIVDRVDHPDRVEWTVTPAATSELAAIATGQTSLFDTSGDAA